MPPFDRRQTIHMAWLRFNDLLEYGPGISSMVEGSRRCRVIARRRRRDPSYDAAIQKHDDQMHEQGYGVTSSGYIVGSAGDFI